MVAVQFSLLRRGVVDDGGGPCSGERRRSGRFVHPAEVMPQHLLERPDIRFCKRHHAAIVKGVVINRLLLVVREFLRHDDRHVRPARAEVVDERLADRCRIHVVGAFQHVAARVDGGEMFAHLQLHETPAGEAEVHDRHVEHPPDDVHERHAGTRRAESLCEGRSVEDDRLDVAAAVRRQPRNGRLRRDAEGELADTVEERQIHETRRPRRPVEREAAACGAADTPRLHVEPSAACRVEPVDVDAARTRGRHVVRLKARIVRHPLEHKRLRICREPELHPGRVVLHCPDVAVDACRHVRGQTVVVMLRAVERPSLNGQVPSVDPLDAVRDDARYFHVRIESADAVLRARGSRTCRDCDTSGKDHGSFLSHLPAIRKRTCAVSKVEVTTKPLFRTLHEPDHAV